MSPRFEELDWQHTPMGDISLRRRRELSLQIDVYEVKLGDEFLMSSLFTAAEQALATLGLGELDSCDLDVVVGGLGLGYTARAVLAARRVRSLAVVEALGEVIGWHERGLLPMAAELTDDPRCTLVHGDFFALVASGAGFGAAARDASPAQRYDAILVDIDHSPRQLLHPSHAAFYEPDGLRRLAARLHPGGVFGLWADKEPDDDVLAALREVFASAQAHVVTFPNHYTGATSSSTVYVARVAGAG